MEASRETAPILQNREITEKDPSIMEQFAAEITQASHYIDSQTGRIRHITDQLFGTQPQTEGSAERGLDEVRSQTDGVSEAINRLNNMTKELACEIERLETHRLV